MKYAAILGCSRSGTSILGEMFEHLKGVTYMFEPTLFQMRWKAREERGKSRWLVAKQPQSCLKLGPERTQGLTCDMDVLLEKFPTIRNIWIVRNPLDTVCSLRPGIEDGWRHHPRPPMFEEMGEESWVVKGAMHWLYINVVGYSFAQKYGELLTVRYEDLIVTPGTQCARILSYLGMPHDLDSLKEHIARISDKTEGSYQAKRQDRWFRPNHSSRMGRYKENMTSEEIALCLDITGKALGRFGYFT